MTYLARFLARLGLVGSLMGGLVVPAALSAQQAMVSTASRTEWGDPDLEGTWLTGNTAGRPFQRPATPSDASLLAELVEGGAIERYNRLDEDQSTGWEQQALADWKATHTEIVPLVTSPESGRVPAVHAEAQARADRQWRTTVRFRGPWEGPSAFGPSERCISRGPLGSMLPAMDYSAIQIVQAPGVVTIRHEAIHEARVILLDDTPPISESIRGYMGDARGHWDGDTLVVESSRFNGKTGAQAHGNELPTSERLRLVERFTPAGEGMLRYEMAVTDSGTWAAPWTVAFPLARTADYTWSEYACHEGNYAMRNLLSISRAAEGPAAPPAAAPRPPRPPRALPPLPQRPPQPSRPGTQR
jgi:hypothetical protein